MMLSCRKVAVTGAAGFIGSHLCDALLADGGTVVGLDRRPADLAQGLRYPAFITVGCDLAADDVVPWLRGADAVVHLAAHAGQLPSWTDFAGYLRDNVLVTQRLLEAMLTAGVPKLVYVSSSSVYGRHAIYQESGPFLPVSPYGVSKLAAELLCRAYAMEHGLHVDVVRPFSVYGPRQRPDMVHHLFIDALLNGRPVTVDGDGGQARANTYVSDVVDGIRLVMEHGEGGAYNIGGDDCTTISDMLTILEGAMGVKADRRQGAPRRGDQSITKADTTRLRALGWEPKVGLAEGLARQVEWQHSESRVPLTV